MLATYEPHLHALVLDSLSDGVITVDEQGAITSFNRAAEQLTGWSRADVLGRSSTDVLGIDRDDDAC